MHNRLLLLIFTFMVVACESSTDVDSPEVIQLDGILEQLPEIATGTLAPTNTQSLKAVIGTDVIMLDDLLATHQLQVTTTRVIPSITRTPVPTRTHTATPPVVLLRRVGSLRLTVG